MNAALLLGHYTFLSLDESWQRTLTTMVDRPLSVAYWKLEEMSGEQFLDDLPEIIVDPGKISEGVN